MEFMDDPEMEYEDDPDFVDRSYAVPSMSDLALQPEVEGVARFIELPSFDPERIYTVVYRSGWLEISAVVGMRSLWDSLSQHEPFDPGNASRQSVTLALSSPKCPPLLRSWPSLRTASADAGPCWTPSFDGIGYWHRLADREYCSDAKWHNPYSSSPQSALIEAYVELLRGVGLYPEQSSNREHG